MAKTRKSNTEFEMNTGANESVAKVSKKRETGIVERGVGEVVQLPGGYTRRLSRGNDRKTVLRRHVLRNSMLPVVTFLAVTLADIVAGSIIIEQVFNIPGLGRMLLLSIANRDHPVVLAIVMMISALVIFVNFLADAAYQLIDPRIRLK